MGLGKRVLGWLTGAADDVATVTIRGADDVAPAIVRGAEDVAPAAVRAADDVLGQAGRIDTLQRRVNVMSAITFGIPTVGFAGFALDQVLDGRLTQLSVVAGVEAMREVLDTVTRENLESTVDGILGVREFFSGADSRLAGRIQGLISLEEFLPEDVSQYVPDLSDIENPEIRNQMIGLGAVLSDEETMQNLMIRTAARTIAVDELYEDSVEADTYIAQQFIVDVQETLDVGPLKGTPVTDATVRQFLERLPEESRTAIPERLRVGLENVYPDLDLSVTPTADVDPAVEGQDFSVEALMSSLSEGGQGLRGYFASTALGTTLAGLTMFDSLDEFWTGLREQGERLSEMVGMDMSTVAALGAGGLAATFGMMTGNLTQALSSAILIGSIIKAGIEAYNGDYRSAATTFGAGLVGSSLINSTMGDGNFAGAAIGGAIVAASETFLANNGETPRMEMPSMPAAFG